ncbi:class I SAM-dependent DNA methyltransferase [Nocardia callitridis]|uniref:Class I SAM-dependent methyltransferase n=1 Tax=Nocardia callitridis TaxID=648753 RepID=A0ABP9JW11_9NOCA
MTEISPDRSDIARTRAAYDAFADLYTEATREAMASQPFDRAMLGAYADLVGATGAGRVLEVGCGPGRITAHLHTLGLDTEGMDLSPRMIELAEKAYPELTFGVGSLERLDRGNGTLAGIVAWYSLIHLPPERVPDVLNEFYRVLRGQGHALLAFQATDTPDAVEAFDHKVTGAYKWAPERLSALLTATGFTVRASLVRAASEREHCQHAYLLASKPG